jgi:hypothetical protein
LGAAFGPLTRELTREDAAQLIATRARLPQLTLFPVRLWIWERWFESAGAYSPSWAEVAPRARCRQENISARRKKRCRVTTRSQTEVGPQRSGCRAGGDHHVYAPRPGSGAAAGHAKRLSRRSSGLCRPLFGVLRERAPAPELHTIRQPIRPVALAQGLAHGAPAAPQRVAGPQLPGGPTRTPCPACAIGDPHPNRQRRRVRPARLTAAAGRPSA